jgi:hypothetical protein
MAWAANDPNTSPPTSQTAQPSAGSEATAPQRRPRMAPGGQSKWLKLAQSAYRSSTSYIDSNYRKGWDDSIRAFNSQHPGDSKYSQPAYDKRSHLYRPKTRSVIRKNEAAAAAAFFSNVKVLTVEALDMSSKAQVASAAVMEKLVEYRLDKSIMWFQTLLGGFQDAQTVGVSIAHIHWSYVASDDKGGKNPSEEDDESNVVQLRPKPKTAKVDKPCIDLIPIENFRFDPSASWVDPIGTSPYLIHLIPMYAQDVKERMESGEWYTISDGALVSASAGMTDSTRAARGKDAQDPYAPEDREIDAYQIVWVQRHIHKDGAKGDVEFYTVGDTLLLCEPKPLVEIVFHGERPYVCGCCILETHKTIPSSLPMIGKGLQDEANEVVNQSLDNVKFVLNKKWFVKRGKEADVAGLVRNVPGGVVMLDDPVNDVREISWPDVTGSSFETQNRINLDMDELLGNFNPAGLMANGGANAPARNMAMTSQANGTLVEYLIRTFVETFAIPVLRQLILLEQEYETDRVVLAIAAKQAQLFQRFDIDEVTDELLSQELTMKINVGMGATDPSQKLQKLLAGVTAFSNIVSKPAPGLDTNEVGREIFATMGYQDGSRFINVDNPQVAQLEQALQEAHQIIQKLETQVKEKTTGIQAGVLKNRETQSTKKEVAAIQEEAANKRALATHFTALLAPHSAPPSPSKNKAA